MAYSRVQYAVRCRSKYDPTLFVDMWVLAAVCVSTPNAGAIMYVTAGFAANPYIADNTGGGNGTGNATDCTRVSHMVRFTGATDPSQILDLEFLDGFTILQTNYAGQGGATDTNVANNYADDQGWADSGRDGLNVAHGIFCPVNGASCNIGDKFNTGLAQSSNDQNTRACHVNIVTSDGNTDDHTTKPYPLNPFPPVGVPWLASIKTDIFTVIGPSNNFLMYGWAASQAISGNPGISDITKYVTDQYDPAAVTDKVAPPDNKDKNVYASFPQNSTGANLGANPTCTHGGQNNQNINQGPLWWMKRISPVFQPWFWYCPAQTPLAIGFYAGGGSIGPRWSLRGFQLLNYYPVIWILAENNPQQPMGDFGAGGDTTPNGPGQYPEALDVSAANGGPYETTGENNQGGGFPALLNGPPFIAGASGIFAPFGMLPMCQGPPVPQSQWQYVVPTIWQMTGIKPPNKNPAYGTLPITTAAGGNYYLSPTPDQAAEAAQTFADNWNSVANACNDIMFDFCYGAQAGPAGSGGLTLLTGTDSLGNPAPAGWKWDISYTSNFSFTHAGTFSNGLQAGIAGHPTALPLEIFAPATVATIAVGQLDPKKWNTQPATQNPQFTTIPTPWNPDNL